MTPPADEIEKEAKKLMCVYWDDNPEDDNPSHRTSFALKLAAHVIRERKKAVIEARINEQMVYGGSKRHERIPDLISQLSELERGEK